MPDQATGPCTLNRWMVAVAAVVMQAGLGAFYAWSVFRQPLSELYGADIFSVNVTFFIATFVLGFAAFGGGVLMRRVGPRVVGVVGGALYGSGVFLASFAGGSLPVLYLAYGLVAGVGVGMAYVVPVAVLPRWFPEKPGFAYGIAVVGFGAGPGINVPIATALISSTGGPLQAFGVLGPAYLVMVGGAALFLKHPPGGREPPERDGNDKTGGAWYFRETLKT